MEQKDLIRDNVRECTEILLASSKAEMEHALVQMEKLVAAQTSLTVVMLAVVICTVIVIREYVRKPLTAMVDGMTREKPIMPEGAEELRFVTRTYNQFLLENKKIHSQLSYEAAHDVLTGLYNRGAFESFMNGAAGGGLGILTHSFRKVDIICRIGEDTFAVIVPDADSSMEPIIRNKIYQVNRQLENQAGGLPAVGVSAGIAFSAGKDPADVIYQNADVALRLAKRHEDGRCVACHKS